MSKPFNIHDWQAKQRQQRLSEQYYVTANRGPKMGKSLVGSAESDYEEPRVFSSYGEAEAYIKRVKSSGATPGRISSYWVSDKNMNRIEDPVVAKGDGLEITQDEMERLQRNGRVRLKNGSLLVFPSKPLNVKEQTYSGFTKNPEDPASEPFEPTGAVAQFREELRALFGKFKNSLKNPEFIKGVAQIMINWKSLLRSQLKEAIVDYDFSKEELIRVIKQLKRNASGEVRMIKAFEKALGRELTDDEIRGFKIDPSKVGRASLEEDDIDEHHGDDFPKGLLKKSVDKFLDDLKKKSEKDYDKVEDIMKKHFNVDEASVTGTGASVTAGTGAAYATPYAFKKKRKDD